MTGMLEFNSLMLQQIPAFLMSEPIVYIFGTLILAAVVAIIIKAVKL